VPCATKTQKPIMAYSLLKMLICQVFYKILSLLGNLFPVGY